MNVTEDMICLTDEIATSELTLLPQQIWDRVKMEMNTKHRDWYGLQQHQVTERVRRARSKMNSGDAMRTLESSKYANMQDSNRPFLQHHGIYPDRNNPGTYQRLMVFGNPSLFGLLQQRKIECYIDATFDCVPHPFYQCLIFMIFHPETWQYVPIFYILMTHKTQELYWHALAQIVIISDHKIDVNSYTTDFEKAIINSCELQFPEGFHAGCLFHLKQAWRRYLITKLGFLPDQIKYAMSVCMLDLLTILPQDEVEKYGLPFVRSLIE